MSGITRVSPGIGGELSIAPSEIEVAEPAIPAGPSSLGGVGSAPDFGAIIEAQVNDASRLQKIATGKAEALARGVTDDLHGTMISVKEAEISMKLIGSVRNRLLDSFHELWRINL